MALYDWEGEVYRLERAWREIVEAPEPDRVFEDLARAFEAEPSRPPGDELDQLLADRLGEARRAADEATEELRARLRLHRQTEDEISYQIRACQFSLREFTNWGLGYNTGVDVKRNFLEKQLADLRKERRAMRLRLFGDLQTLRKGLREASSEYDRVRYRTALVEEEKHDAKRA